MKHGKIIGILIIVFVAMTFLGVVSAEEVVVNGEKFNIPDGFEKNEEVSFVEKTSTGTDEEAEYDKGVDVIMIYVTSVNGGGIAGLPIIENTTNMTVNGIEGQYWVDEYGNMQFDYLQNRKSISITLNGNFTSFEDIMVEDTSEESPFPFNLF